MKRYVVAALLSLFVVGCAGRSGGARGPVIQRTSDDGVGQRGEVEHVDPSQPLFGQR